MEEGELLTDTGPPRVEIDTAITAVLKKREKKENKVCCLPFQWALRLQLAIQIVLLILVFFIFVFNLSMLADFSSLFSSIAWTHPTPTTTTARVVTLPPSTN